MDARDKHHDVRKRSLLPGDRIFRLKFWQCDLLCPNLLSGKIILFVLRNVLRRDILKALGNTSVRISEKTPIQTSLRKKRNMLFYLAEKMECFPSYVV